MCQSDFVQCKVYDKEMCTQVEVILGNTYGTYTYVSHLRFLSTKLVIQQKSFKPRYQNDIAGATWIIRLFSNYCDTLLFSPNTHQNFQISSVLKNQIFASYFFVNNLINYFLTVECKRKQPKQ